MRRVLLLVCLSVMAPLTVTACGEGESATSNDISGPRAPTGQDAPVGDSGDTTVSGTALPRFEQLENDPAVGRRAPLVVGTDLLTGEHVRIEAQGRPLVVAFYAHWCPHCQSEVAALTDWLESNDLPNGVDFVAVSVLEDSSRPNHPPDAWLRAEGWRHRVIADTPTQSVVDAFGLASVPYLVAIDSHNSVVLRYAGSVGPSQMAGFFESLAQPNA